MKGKVPSHREVLLFLSQEPDISSLLKKYPALSAEALKDIFSDCATLIEQKPSKNRASSRRKQQPSEESHSSVELPPKGRWVAYIDGASRGNPGPAACAAWILTSDGVMELGRRIGNATNNVAEYEALIMVLERALKQGISEVEIRSDSELLVKQNKGEYRAKKPDLVKRLIKAKNLEKKLKYFNITFIPREANKNADRLVNRILDEEAFEAG